MGLYSKLVLGLPSNRRDAYAALFYRVPSSLALLTDRRVQLIKSDGTITKPVTVDLSIPNGNQIILKLEHLRETSPTGSFYDRIYPWLFFRAESEGYIHPATTRVIECSVGNAGAAFANVANKLGYNSPLVILPKDIYPARVQQIRELKAAIEFSPPHVGAAGYIRMLEDNLAEDWRKHGRPRRGGGSALYSISKIRHVPNEPYAEFVNEVLMQLAQIRQVPRIDTFVSGVGSGNTISQVGLAVKRSNAAAKIICCELEEYPFVERLRYGQTPNKIDSWPEPDWPASTIHGVPLKKLSLDLQLIDDVVTAARYARDEGWHLANQVLGLHAGRPGAGVLTAALKIAKSVENQNILGIIFDNDSKYSQKYVPTFFSDLLRVTRPRMRLLQNSYVTKPLPVLADQATVIRRRSRRALPSAAAEWAPKIGAGYALGPVQI